MAAMIVKRLLLAIPTLFGVSIIVFLLLSELPGDPLAGLLAQDATQEDREELADSLGLNDPLPVRYLDWAGDALRGDFGYSPYRRRDVNELIFTAVQNTMQLAVVSAILGVGAGVALGTLAAAIRGGLADRSVSLLAMTGISIPSYWLAILLIIIFSANLKWLPAGGMSGQEPGMVDTLKHLAMPAFASAFVSIGVTARMTRASLIETFGRDFVATLRAKGLSSLQILGHVGKNSLSPVLTVAGLQIGFLLGGSVLVETIFSWPGLGQLIYQSIASRDFRVIQASILVTSVIFVSVNLTVDVIQIVIDPRLRKAA
jgi:peptide/nickel transport system permease protein